MLTDQWFLKMDSMAKDALEVVQRGEVKFFPEHWTSTYNQWLENIQDWCISRQLWWGHQIPAWYDDEGTIYVARTEEEAQKKAGGKNLTSPRATTSSASFAMPSILRNHWSVSIGSTMAPVRPERGTRSR